MAGRHGNVRKDPAWAAMNDYVKFKCRIFYATAGQNHKMKLYCLKKIEICKIT